MKRKYKLRTLKSKKSYSNLELATILGVHIQTVRGWRKNGLNPIDESSHRPLYLGLTIQMFLNEKLKRTKIKLNSDEFYCFGCHDKTTSVKTAIVFQNKLIGKNIPSITKEGLCIKCGKKVYKFDNGETNDLNTTKVINRGLSSSL